MREINRAQYLRGTKAWSMRNYFVFGTLTLTVLSGVATYFLFPGQVAKIQRISAEEKEEREAKRKKVQAIQHHRMELLAKEHEEKLH